MRILLMSFVLTMSLVGFAWAGDCGGCNAGCGDCQVKCDPCKPDPCGERLCRPKCLSTDCFEPAGRTIIPVGRTDCKRIDISCCSMGVFELLDDCAGCYTLCPNQGEFELLCDVACEPCKPCKPCGPKCDFSFCSEGDCAQPKCGKCHTCSDC